jgi:lipopolysaccharide assembly protein A
MMKRYFYISLAVILTIIILLFTFQNIGNVSIEFLSMSITLPISLLVIGVYILGMLTGGSVFAFIKTVVTKTKEPVNKPD